MSIRFTTLFLFCILSLFCAASLVAATCRVDFDDIINEDEDSVDNATIYTLTNAPAATVKPVVILVADKINSNKCLLKELAAQSSANKFVTTALVKNNAKSYATIAAIRDYFATSATQITIGGVGSGAATALRFVGQSNPKQYSFVSIDGQLPATVDYSTPDKIFPATLINSNAAVQAQQASTLPLSALKAKFNSATPGDVTSDIDTVISAITSAYGVSNIFPASKRAQALIQANPNFVRTAGGYYQIKATGTASRNALVFIPGGSVESTAYIDTLQQVAAAGFDVYLAPIPYSNAFMEPYVGNLFDKIMTENAAKYDKVSVGGHSLGAYAATVYVKNQRHPKIAGLANISCRCNRAGDVSQSPAKQLLVYGTQDSLPITDYTLVQVPLLRNDSLIVQIDGANHSQFGSYDFQKNGVEGIGAISEQSQQQQVAAAIIAHLQSL